MVAFELASQFFWSWSPIMELSPRASPRTSRVLLVISVAAYALPFSGAARAAPDATTCYVAIFNLSTIRIATDTAFAASS